MAADIEIDLDDGLPPIKTEALEKPKKKAAFIPERFAAPKETFTVTSTPIALVISVADVHCLGCGADHKDHRGLFVENKLSNGVHQLKRTTLRELPESFTHLPRRVDVAPKEVVPLCYDCFLVERAFTAAAALAKNGVFGDVAQPQEVAAVAWRLQTLHAEGLLDDDIVTPPKEELE